MHKRATAFLILAFGLLLMTSPHVSFAATCLMTYSSPGTYTCEVPTYSSGQDLVVELWGGGAAGNYSANGGLSSFNGSVVAGGGVGANGGVASGGDVNVNGNPAGGWTTTTVGTTWSSLAGGTAPYGGAGGSNVTSGCTTGWANGQAPGGGGAGCFSSGGGSGAYSKKTYTAASLPAGTSVSIVVGGGGPWSWLLVGWSASGAGGSGRVRLSFVPTSSPPPNQAPATPTVSGGACTVGQPVTYTFTATDPDGDDVYFYVKWTSTGAEVRVPASGDVASGAAATVTHTWSTEGAHDFYVVAVDSSGLRSDSVSGGTAIASSGNCTSPSSPASCVPGTAPSGWSYSGGTWTYTP